MIDPKGLSAISVEEDEYWSDARLMQPEFIPERSTFSNGRFYKTQDNVWVKSCTTMLKVLDRGVGFMRALGNMPSYAIAMRDWGELADRGSHLHTIIAKTQLGREVDVADLCEADLKKYYTFMQFWFQKLEPIPITVECPMAHTKFPYAGTIDGIYKVSDKKGNVSTVMVDWKSGKEWASYPFQISAYKYLAEACLGITIDKLWIVYLKEFRGTKIPTVDDPPRYKVHNVDPVPLDIILAIDNIYDMIYKNPSPKTELKNPSIASLAKYKEIDNG